jgi:hypothetical protein
MPRHVLQVSQPMFETRSDRMVSEKADEILGSDAGRFGPTRSRVPPDMSAPVAGGRVGPVITGEIRPSGPGK